MASSSSMLSLFLLACSFLISMATASNFYDDFDITYGDGRAKILNNGQLVTLTLDKTSGCGLQSKNEYLFGTISMQLKLIPGYSAGTVTAFYLSWDGPRSTHDEIDFELLGNTTGNPYTLHTNLFIHGTGVKEQQFRLWFDPTMDFHTYTILWNPRNIIFFVDGVPVREFKNHESNGVPFPKSQPMRAYSCIWNADEWATQRGRVKTDWSYAPFTSSCRNFNADACVVTSSGASSCADDHHAWFNQELDAAGRKKLNWVQSNYMIYNYCTDYDMYPHGFPPECSM